MCLKIKHPPERSQNSKRADTIAFLCCTSAAPLLSAGIIKCLQIYFAGICNTTHLAKKAHEMRNSFQKTMWMKIPDGSSPPPTEHHQERPDKLHHIPLSDSVFCERVKEKVVCCLLSSNMQTFSQGTDAGRKPSDSSWTVRSLTIWW